MEIQQPFPVSPSAPRPRPCTGDSSPVSSSSGGNNLESNDPRVTTNLLFEKLKYGLLSEGRISLKTSTLFPRRPRSKAKVSSKPRPSMTHSIAGGISDTHPCPRNSTSQPHARRKGCKRKTRSKDEESDLDEVIVPLRIRKRGRVTRNWSQSNAITNERGKLDSLTFLHYFMHLWNAFPEDKVKSVTYFDPLWLDLYTKGSKPEAVLNWIKGKGVFSKKYVLVPMVMWSHWSLLIFCHLGESLHSETNSPCMLLLDSLHAIGPTRLEPSIRRLLFDMYQSEDRPESHKELKKLRFLIPKVPQQERGDECGFYVLYFIKLFLESAPETFDISAGYPYFMKKDWFSAEEAELFCRRLDALPPAYANDDCALVESGDDDVQLINSSEFYGS